MVMTKSRNFVPEARNQVDEEKDGLLCEKCGLIYPIKDGIPVMLVEEAAPASQAKDD